jgi:prephenate dehydrogenase
MDPEDHDRALAATSHLPHLAASALTATLQPELFALTATGFRDSTRLASGDPALWTGIFLQNRDAVLAALSRLEQVLGTYRSALEADDAERLGKLLATAKGIRDALGS